MRRGTLYVLASAFLWGTTFPATKYGIVEGGLSPVTFVAYRFLVATVAMLIIAVALGKVQRALFADWRLWVIGMAYALGYLFQYVGQSITTASKTSLMVNVNVLITALFAWLLLKERMGRGLIAGLFIGFAGVTLLTTNGEFTVLSGEFAGDALAFGTGVTWTFLVLAIKRYLDERPQTDTIAMNLVVLVVATLSFFVLAWRVDALAIHADAWATANLVYLGIFPTTLAFILWQEGLKATSATVSSVLLLFETVVAVSISVVFLDERFTWWTGAGAALILVALYLASRPPAPLDPVSSVSSAAPSQGPSGPETN